MKKQIMSRKSIFEFFRIEKYLLFVLFIFISSRGLCARRYDDYIIKIAYDKNIKPYSFLDDNNVDSGFEIDLTTLIMNNAHLKYEYYPVSWREAKLGLNDGRYDIILGMNFSLERSKKYYFSYPIKKIPYGFYFLNKNSKKNISYRNFEDKIIGTIDTSYSSFYLKNISSKFKIKNNSNYDSLFMGLKTGRYDALFLGDDISIKDREYSFLPLPISKINNCVVSTFENKTIIHIYNKELFKLIDNGKYTRIKDKWFLDEREHNVYINYIYIIAIIVLVYLISFKIYKDKTKKEEILYLDEEKYVDSVIEVIPVALNVIEENSIRKPIFSNLQYKKIYEDVKDNSKLSDMNLNMDSFKESNRIEKDLELILKNGEKIVLKETISRRKIGKANYVFFHYVSVTDQVVSRNRAVKSNDKKNEFLHNISHEIRTPLNAIVGFSDLLITEEDRETELVYSKIVKENCTLLNKLMNDLLFVSKLEANKYVLNLEKCDLNEVFRNMIAEVHDKVDLNKVDLSVKIPYDSFNFYIDVFLLKFVVMHSLDNALKFTFGGFIKLGYIYSGSEIIFYVLDSGIGIREEKQLLIFDSFTKANVFTQGTGLGMYLSLEIVKSVCGRIGVYSNHGEGSLFWGAIKRKKFEIDYGNKERLLDEEEREILSLMDKGIWLEWNEEGDKIVHKNRGDEKAN